MKLVDANVLLYAVNEDAAHHRGAHEWLDSSLGRREPIAFAWVVLLAFLRLSTDVRVFSRPLSLEEAFGVVESWLSRPVVVVLHPGDRHLGLLGGLLGSTGTTLNLVNDAHLAALALEHGAEIVSFDRDFERFSGVRWRSP